LNLMDDVEQLIDTYRMRASATSKLGVLTRFEQIDDPRILPFLLNVLRDRTEAEEVRVHALWQLRCGDELLTDDERPDVARTLGDVMADRSTPDLQLQAALTLGDFVQVEGVLVRLNAVCLAQDEPIDLRYAAFTSLERAGPTPESVELLRQMTSDETLGRSARSLLAAWHVDEPFVLRGGPGDHPRFADRRSSGSPGRPPVASEE
jgi:hypothetical protein